MLAHRLNEVDQRLLKYSIDMNIKHRDDTSGDPNALKRGRQDIGLNRTSTMQAEERARLAKDKKGSRKGDSSSHDITADMKLQTNMNLQILDQS